MRVGVTLGGVPVEGDIVDACHGPLLHLGRLATCFSLHGAKHVVAGEGGAIVTNDADFAARCRLLRSHGRDGTKMVALGYNYRMPEMCAALARSQLTRYHENVQERRRLALCYDRLFAGTEVCPVPHPTDSARHLYHVLVKDRDRVQAVLKGQGIGTAIHYPSIPHQPYYVQRYGEPEGLSWAQDYAAKTLSIPLYPGLTEADQQRVVQAIKEAV